MQIRQFTDDQDIQDIKNIVQELSFSQNNLQEWFQDYPVENLDYFKDFILQSPLSLWVFQDKKMIGFVVSYDISNTLNIQKTQDPILQYLLQKQYLDSKSVYIDILWIIQNMQNKWIGVHLLRSLMNYIKQQEFKNIRCVVCLDSHSQNSNIYKILKYVWLEIFEKITDNKWNNFEIYKMDLK